MTLDYKRKLEEVSGGSIWRKPVHGEYENTPQESPDGFELLNYLLLHLFATHPPTFLFFFFNFSFFFFIISKPFY